MATSERVALFITYDPSLITPEFMSEHVNELEGVEVIRIEEAD